MLLQLLKYDAMTEKTAITPHSTRKETFVRYADEKLFEKCYVKF